MTKCSERFAERLQVLEVLRGVNILLEVEELKSTSRRSSNTADTIQEQEKSYVPQLCQHTLTLQIREITMTSIHDK